MLHALVALMISASAQAQPCVSDLSLQLVSGAHGSGASPVQLHLSLEEKVVTATFTVHDPTPYGSHSPAAQKSPFYFDVVELFLSVEGSPSNLPYYELDVSLFDQPFTSMRDVHGKFHDGFDAEFTHSVTVQDGVYTVTLTVPLEKLHWTGDTGRLIGNAFAALGHGPTRTFWSVSLPPQVHPNFHKPEFFKPLFINAAATCPSTRP